MKDAFDISFDSEEIELNENKETAKTWKKKLKDDKESIKNADFLIKQKYMLKRAASSAENHHDDSESRNQVFKKHKYWACSEFYLYKKCYYLFSDLVSEA